MTYSSIPSYLPVYLAVNCDICDYFWGGSCVKSILPNNPFAISELDEMIKGQNVDRKSLNPKTGYGGGRGNYKVHG